MDPRSQQLLKSMQSEKLKEINGVEAKIKALTQARDELFRDLEALKTLLRTGNGSSDTDWLNTSDAPENMASLEKMGFRDAVRTILKEMPAGLTSGQVRKQLEGRGYIYKAATPLAIRISNELRRMGQQGMIRKQGKTHVLTEKGRSMT